MTGAHNDPAVGRGGKRLPWLTLSLAGLAWIGFVFAGPAPASWVFDRAAVQQGEWWRLLSSHWVHSDSQHLLWNIAAFTILGWLLERASRLHLIVSLTVGMLAVDLGIDMLLPNLDLYCGLSGVLNTLLLMVLGQLWQQTRHPVILLSSIAAAIKLLIELATQHAVFTHTVWPSVPQAHLAGSIAGLGLLILVRLSHGVFAQCGTDRQRTKRDR